MSMAGGVIMEGGGPVLPRFFAGLALGAGAGDRARHTRVHQDPPQRELPQRRPGRHERAKFVNRGKRGVERYAGERLADVEQLSVPVERPVIVGGERAVRPERARQQPARQGHARDHADLAGRRLGEKRVSRLVPEHVEDDLHGLDVRMPHRHPGLVDGLDAHAVVADLARSNQIVQHAEHLATQVDGRRRTVQLQQIERIDAQVGEAVVHPGLKVLAAVPFGHLRGQPPARLGRHDQPFAGTLAEELADEPFAAAVAVDVRGVDERGARVDRRVERLHRLLVVDRAPESANRPSPKPHCRHRKVGPAERVVFHGRLGSHATCPGAK
jgi:hypothetical protein